MPDPAQPARIALKPGSFYKAMPDRRKNVLCGEIQNHPLLMVRDAPSLELGPAVDRPRVVDPGVDGLLNVPHGSGKVAREVYGVSENVQSLGVLKV